ncbi:hypothetical protein MYCTH_104945 [Thermothelomyces thermophilus ATCC 42464]|uniref:UBC core domain-containing protein n=1 Tax=Thermothelomyces thermophilus (strain ATCC 42464 / BCRC 31852 / DSM 1799) TaxID=573729 RepID=G2Q3X8_THET4|nr:uncharacterized protein MYCTH_104945 [Thermothelomyces thermophilus ATCC 42464]AEO55281.1 hypothetical protein MYCTH_104945 [Thermothelomyces thermophilus ATCC 42464]
MSTSSLPAVKRQHLLAEFAGLKHACPHGIFVSLTPGDPTLWSGVMFVRKGPYAPAILRFHISFPDAYPALPPLVTFSTDMFHPLITPLTTYMYSTDVQDGGTASANDDERLPPGGFSLRHGFPGWFGRGRRAAAAAAIAVAAKAASSSGGGGDGGGDSTGGSGAKTEGNRDAVAVTPMRPVATATGTTPASAVSAAASSVSAPGSYARTGTGSTKEVSTYEVLRYIRSTFDDEDVLDSIPLEAAGNPGAWHAWRTHRRHVAAKGPSGAGEIPGREGGAQADKGPAPSPVAATGAAASAAAAVAAAAAATKRPDEWNWEGVWEERVKRNIASSLSEGVLYGHAGAPDEVINFLNMDEAEVEGAKSNLLRTLGAAA